MTGRHRRLSALLTLACVVPAAACTSSPTTDPAPSPSSTTAEPAAIVVNAVEPARSLLPADVGSDYGRRIAGLIFRGLTRYDAKGQLINEVAEEISWEDPTLLRIKLRKDRVFGNGEPVTAASFVNAWTYAATPAHDQLHGDAFLPIAGAHALRGLAEPTGAGSSPPSGTATPTAPSTPSPAPTAASSPSATPAPTGISGLHIVDALEFTVRLAAPDATFPDRLATLPFAPLPAAALKDPAAFALAPVGNGPYQLTVGGWLPGKEITLIPNSSYLGSDKARNPGVTFRFFPDSSLTYPALRSGRLDALDAVPLAALDRYKADLGFRGANQTVGAQTSLVFPMGRPEWAGADGALLRKAISRAIDRRALADGLFAGTRAPASNYSSPVISGYTPDLCGDACRYDAGAAADLLSPRKTPAPPIQIAYGVDGGGRPVVEALCSALTSHLKIGCTPLPVPSQATLERAAASHEVTVPMLATQRMSRPDLGGFLSPRFLAGSSDNPSGYAGAKAQTLLARAAAEKDAGARTDLYREAQRAILEDLPEVPLWYVNATVSTTDRMQPARYDVFGLPLYPELSHA